jgi:hypothetical protein
MRTAIQSSWTSRHRDQQPAYTNPRLAPIPPSEKSSSPFKALQAVFVKKQPRLPSANSQISLNTVYTTSSQTSTLFSETLPPHPYAAMLPAPLPVVSDHNSVTDKEECPVCLESLTFSFRLPGEKAPIVPECGHALHEVRSISPPFFGSVSQAQAFELIAASSHCRGSP